MRGLQNEHVHFVTGRLAAGALRELVARLAAEAGFRYSVEVLPITVAALMRPAWIARHWSPPAEATRIVLPGLCRGGLEPLQATAAAPVEFGPIDLRSLPEYFSRPPLPDDYGRYDIEVIAEINHCPRLGRDEILARAAAHAADGADVIDVGCDPDGPWPEAGATVAALRAAGHRVSIDSFDPREVAAATAAGAELVLSVNRENCRAAADWGVEVVAIPDRPDDLASLDETANQLARDGVRFRLDPILEPIGFGFAASLRRYLDVRERYPGVEIMMGIGNLTELTDVDSAGVNALLIGFCQEVGVRSVLTTQVINWARTSVRECDVARRLMHHAVRNRVLPKHLERRLLMLRDEQVVETSPAEIAELATQLRDANYRVFASGGEIHAAAAGIHCHDADPFCVMDQLLAAGPGGSVPRNLTPDHAFYLGYEMAKASLALALGKTYRQDQPLDGGVASRAEPDGRHGRAPRHRRAAHE
jgi:dihydropteroate synthase